MTRNSFPSPMTTVKTTMMMKNTSPVMMNPMSMIPVRIGKSGLKFGKCEIKGFEAFASVLILSSEKRDFFRIYAYSTTALFI